jgi:hypothetical protein
VPASPPTQFEYARLCFRASVHFLRDATALDVGHWYAGVIVACQHAWEMAAKAALGIEAVIFTFPPHRTIGPRWMRDHRVLSHVDVLCNRLRLTQRSLRRCLDSLEYWLPPGPHLGNPPVSSEYFFDGGPTWKLPSEFFRAAHAKAALGALRKVLGLLKTAYPAELKGISIK